MYLDRLAEIVHFPVLDKHLNQINIQIKQVQQVQKNPRVFSIILRNTAAQKDICLEAEERFSEYGGFYFVGPDNPAAIEAAKIISQFYWQPFMFFNGEKYPVICFEEFYNLDDEEFGFLEEEE